MERTEGEEFFVRIFRQYRGMILAAVYQRTQDYELAQDICQQAALAVWIHLEEFARLEEEARKAWLLRVTGNFMKDHWKKPSTRYERIWYVGIPYENDPEDARVQINWTSGFADLCPVSGLHPAKRLTDAKEYQMDCEELLQKILRETRRENEDWYRLMDLIFVKEYSQEEAAQILDISVQMLRARLYRARKFIRKRFGEEYRCLKNSEE